MKRAAPYGSWESPITPDLLPRKRLAYPTFVGTDAIAWLEARPEESGRQTIVLRAADGSRRDLVPAPFNARTRVHEYGGLPFVFAGASLVFSNDADKALYRVDDVLGTPTEPTRLTTDDFVHGGKIRIGEPIHDPARNRLIAIGEVHTGARYPENGIVSIDLATGAVDWLIQGHDFFSSLALSPSGAALAFLTWDHPHMPWDAATVRVADLAVDGALKRSRAIAGGPSGSAFQPTYSPSGELHFALESATFAWSIHRLRTGNLEVVHASEDEWGAPLWNLGTTLFGFSAKQTIVGAIMRDGRGHLVDLDVSKVKATLTERGDFGHIGQLQTQPGRGAVFTTGWAGSGTALYLAEPGKAPEKLVDAFADVTSPGADGPPILGEADISVAEAITFYTTDDDVAHGYFYAPASSTFEPADASPPPLIVLAHGGPTGCTSPTLSLTIQQYTTRGYAVLDVNYRGSNGFGRAYREKLRGRWGDADVDDCVRGALALASAGKVDRKRLFIRGGSAGGFVVLMAVCKHPDVFAAASCLYGISDPRSCGADTHKFESQYDRFLFGDEAARERAFEERAPLLLADRIRTPVIFFQGLEDKAVPPAQTEQLFRALEKNGVRTEYHPYEGEQHGFRRAETVRDVATRELAWFASARPRAD